MLFNLIKKNVSHNKTETKWKCFISVTSVFKSCFANSKFWYITFTFREVIMKFDYNSANLTTAFSHFRFYHFVFLTSKIKISPGIRKYVPDKMLPNSLHKNWSFLLGISSVNVAKSPGNCGLVTFTEEILNGKLHFLWSDCYLYIAAFSVQTSSTVVFTVWLLSEKNGYY